MREIALLKSRLDKNGGAEKYTWRLCEAFLKQHCTVHLLTSGTPLPPPKHPNLIMHSLTSKKWLSVSKVRAFDQFCHAHTANLPKSTPIFGLDRNTFQTHIRASNGVHAAYLNHRKLSDSPLKSLSFHLNPLHRVLLAIERASFTHPSLRLLITNSHLVKQEILSYYPVDPHKIHVVHNGVEWQEKEAPFSEWHSSKCTLCQNNHLDPDAFHLLFLGHNYRRKGLIPLLKGFSLIPDRSVHLSVIGKEKNGSFFRYLAKQLGLQDRVHFFGAKSDPTPFYQLADALVIPSYYDPFANVTVEALAMGLFVVSSKTNGGHEVLTQQTGCSIDALNDPESVQAALNVALKHKKTETSARAIRSSIQHLDFTSQLQRITELVLS